MCFVCVRVCVCVREFQSRTFEITFHMEKFKLGSLNILEKLVCHFLCNYRYFVSEHGSSESHRYTIYSLLSTISLRPILFAKQSTENKHCYENLHSLKRLKHIKMHINHTLVISYSSVISEYFTTKLKPSIYGDNDTTSSPNIDG